MESRGSDVPALALAGLRFWYYLTMSTATSSKTRQVSIELPADLIERAERAGLLAAPELERLLLNEIRRQAWVGLNDLHDSLAVEEETDELMDEVLGEIKAARRANGA